MDKQNTKRNCKSNTKQIRTEKKKTHVLTPTKRREKKKKKEYKED